MNQTEKLAASQLLVEMEKQGSPMARPFRSVVQGLRNRFGQSGGASTEVETPQVTQQPQRTRYHRPMPVWARPPTPRPTNQTPPAGWNSMGVAGGPQMYRRPPTPTPTQPTPTQPAPPTPPKTVTGSPQMFGNQPYAPPTPPSPTTTTGVRTTPSRSWMRVGRD